MTRHLTLAQLSNTLQISDREDADAALRAVGGYIHLKHRAQLTRRNGLMVGDATLSLPDKGNEAANAIQVMLGESFSSKGNPSFSKGGPSALRCTPSASELDETFSSETFSSAKGSPAFLQSPHSASVLDDPALADLNTRYPDEPSMPAAKAGVQLKEMDKAARSTVTEATTDKVDASCEQRLIIRHSMLETIRALGSGVVGQVHLVRHSETGAAYALKSMRKKAYVASKATERVLDEVSLLRSCCSHPSIITLHAAFQDSTHLHLLTEVALGGELFDLVSAHGPLFPPHARFYAASLNAALIHCHDQQVIYRDLKPENVLLDSAGHVKLCDFGFTKRSPCTLPSPRLAPPALASVLHLALR